MFRFGSDLFEALFFSSSYVLDFSFILRGTYSPGFIRWIFSHYFTFGIVPRFSSTTPRRAFRRCSNSFRSLHYFDPRLTRAKPFRFVVVSRSTFAHCKVNTRLRFTVQVPSEQRSPIWPTATYTRPSKLFTDSRHPFSKYRRSRLARSWTSGFMMESFERTRSDAFDGSFNLISLSNPGFRLRPRRHFRIQ